MSTLNLGRQVELRAVVSGFLTERLDSKQKKLKPDDPKSVELRQRFTPSIWLGNAADRVAGLQGVTHSLKPMHPKANELVIRRGSLVKQLHGMILN